MGTAGFEPATSRVWIRLGKDALLQKATISRTLISPIWRPESAMRRDMRGYAAVSGTSGEKCLGYGVAVRDGKDRRR
jgi:hypothetical protein